MTSFPHWLLSAFCVGLLAAVPADKGIAQESGGQTAPHKTVAPWPAGTRIEQEKGIISGRDTNICSPVDAGNRSGGAVTINCTFGASAEDNFDVQLIHARLSCNSEQEASDLASGYANTHASDLFERLQELDEIFVYIDLLLGVGYGCGLHEVANQPAPRWGVVYDLNGKAPYSTNEENHYLDGFPGPHDKYDYGYRIEFGSHPWEASILLFPPDEGSAFFNARYGKAFHLEGIAKIRVTEWQLGTALEIVPATPVGPLANHYNRLKRYVREKYNRAQAIKPAGTNAPAPSAPLAPNLFGN